MAVARNAVQLNQHSAGDEVSDSKLSTLITHYPQAAHWRQRNGAVRVGERPAQAPRGPSQGPLGLGSSCTLGPLLPGFPYYFVHLEAGKPVDIAWQIVTGLNALRPVGGGVAAPVFNDLIPRLVLRIRAYLHVVNAGRAQAGRHACGCTAGFLDIDGWDLCLSGLRR